jgi:hypothetical protein
MALERDSEQHDHFVIAFGFFEVFCSIIPSCRS